MSEAVDEIDSSRELGTPASGVNGVLFTENGLRVEVEPSRVLAHRFAQPGFLSHQDIGQLGVVHRRLMVDLCNRLSTFLRMEVSCDKRSVKCVSQTFSEFCACVEAPTHLSLFQIAPFDGVGVLEIRPNTALALANRLLGGKGAVDDLERNPTEIEVALLDEVVVILLKEWCSVFEQGSVGSPVILGHEANTRFLQVASDSTAFFVLRADLAVGDLCEQIQLAVPFSLVDALSNHLSSFSKKKSSKAPEVIRSKPLQWRAPYAAISVELTAKWDIREATLGEILDLKPGDLVMLPQDLIDRTKVSVSGADEFFGTVGVDNGCLAVHLNERISKE
jgi:flagellar motor switch protein FliM